MTNKRQKKALTLECIASMIKGNLVGEGSIVITGASGIKEAVEGDITFVHDTKYLKYLNDTKASAVILKEGWDNAGLPTIFVKEPYFAFATVVREFYELGYFFHKGISERAVVHHDVKLGKGVSIQPLAVIEPGVEICENTIIGAGSYIGLNTKIGSECIIHPNVTIRENIIIGNRVIIHSGSVIGSDGFGYAHNDKGFFKIPQIGTVIIGDEVEIGANCTIDRATLGATKIGDATKIDNLVQIAHNVEVGKNCAIVAQVGISGSTIIGDNVKLGGQVGVIGHLRIGDEAQVAAQSGVAKDIPAGTRWMGSPARPLMDAKRIEAFLSRYDRIMDRLRELEKKVERDKSK